MNNMRIVRDLEEIKEIAPDIGKTLMFCDVPFVFLVNETPTIFGEIDIGSDDAYIRMMKSVEKGKGYGGQFIEYLKNLPQCVEIWGESILDAIPFWSKMGAEFNSTIYKEYESYLKNGTSLEEDYLLPFSIHCKNKELSH